VARAFASEGAKVHLAGSTLDSLVEVAEEIRSTGGALDCRGRRCARRSSMT